MNRCPECHRPCNIACAGPHPDYDFDRAVRRGDVEGMGSRNPYEPGAVLYNRVPDVPRRQWRVHGEPVPLGTQQKSRPWRNDLMRASGLVKQGHVMATRKLLESCRCCGLGGVFPSRRCASCQMHCYRRGKRVCVFAAVTT